MTESVFTGESITHTYKILEGDNLWDIIKNDLAKHPQWGSISEAQQGAILNTYKDSLTDTRQYTPTQINTLLKEIFFNREDGEPIDPFVVYAGEEINLGAITGDANKLGELIEENNQKSASETTQVTDTVAPGEQISKTPTVETPQTDKSAIDNLLTNAFSDENLDPANKTLVSEGVQEGSTTQIETNSPHINDLLELSVNLNGLKPETLYEANTLRTQIFQSLKNQPLTSVEEFSTLSNTNTRAIAKIFGENSLDHISDSPYPIDHMQRARLYILSGIKGTDPSLANNQTIQYMHSIYEKQLEDGHDQLIIESSQTNSPSEVVNEENSIELGAMSPELEIKLEKEAHIIWQNYLKDHNFATIAMSKLSSGTNLEMGAINKAINHMNSIADTVGNNDGKIESIDVLSTAIFMINHIPEEIQEEIKNTQLYANLRNEAFEVHLNRPTYNT